MTRRDVATSALLALGVLVVGFGCFATYGVLREYGDVCGRTSVLTQVWASGAGLGPVVGAVAMAFAVVIVVVGRRPRARAAAAALVVLALVGATAAGAIGVAGKRAAYEEKPSTYGGCSGYNS